MTFAAGSPTTPAAVPFTRRMPADPPRREAPALLTPAELEAALRHMGETRYHSLHPFHRLLHGGTLSRDQVRAWALNRYYYQAMIPVKDATLLARMDDPAMRRVWRQRIVDHDGDGLVGDGDGDGGIARWLKLTDSLDLPRAYVISGRGILPATRFAVDAYVRFVGEKPLLDAIASSLTELFSPSIISARVSGMLRAYDFVSPGTLAYFDKRLIQAPRDARFALDHVLQHARTIETQQAALDALRFKCDVLWAQLDALYLAYVEPRLPPPDAWLPGRELQP